jgi:MAP kinase interacting serine/threonine kinase
MAVVLSMEHRNTMPEGEDRVRRRKKRSPRGSLCATFRDQYSLPGEPLGEGSTGKVETCVNVFTGLEYAVKIIRKVPGLFNRSKVLKEIELYHLCRGQATIVQLVEFFEEPDEFFLVFEKMRGGPLLSHIQRRGSLTEQEAASITEDIATALAHLHSLGVAHRDIKPDNVLCLHPDSPCPVKLCDFDLCSTPEPSAAEALLSPVGSPEYMAPEVVHTFLSCDDDDDDDMSLSYTKACDLWSLGVLLYTLLSGTAPFSGSCPAEDCGWERGASCAACQERLLAAIAWDRLAFPLRRWEGVSDAARRLVSGLLLRDQAARLTAREVLADPWLQVTGRAGALPDHFILHPGMRSP